MRKAAIGRKDAWMEWQFSSKGQCESRDGKVDEKKRKKKWE